VGDGDEKGMQHGLIFILDYTLYLIILTLVLDEKDMQHGRTRAHQWQLRLAMAGLVLE